MARKNPFAGIMDNEGEKTESPIALDYTINGCFAVRSLIRSTKMASHC